MKCLIKKSVHNGKEFFPAGSEVELNSEVAKLYIQKGFAVEVKEVKKAPAKRKTKENKSNNK